MQAETEIHRRLDQMRKHVLSPGWVLGIAVLFGGIGYLWGVSTRASDSPLWLWRRAVSRTAAELVPKNQQREISNDLPAPERKILAARFLAEGDWDKLEHLLAEWVARDVYGALEWANGLAGNRRAGAMQTILYAWLKQDPEVACQWASDFEPEIIQTDRFYQSLAETGRFDLGVAAVNRLNFKAFAIGALLGSWAERDRAGAQHYAVQLRAAGDANWLPAASAVAKQWAGEDLRAAGEWLDQLGADQRSLRNAYEDLARGAVARGHVDELLDWVTKSQASYALNGAYSALAEHYVKSDPDQAAVWLNAISDPDLRGRSYNAINELGFLRPDLAAPMLEQLTDAPLRDKRIGLLVDRWVKLDPEAAWVFVNKTAALSPSARTALLARSGAITGGGK